MTIKEYAKKNWRSIALITVIALLVLFNVKQYQGSQAIVRENQEINAKYQALQQREDIYNQQIAEYKSQVQKKDSAITSEKSKVQKTEAQLEITQSDVRKLSKRILNQNTDNQVDLQDYVKNCDSLATVAPVLADQVDTLKSQNKALVTTMEEKSVLQDSIIKKKDVIITENKSLLATTVDSYNKATDKLVFTENKLNKEKKRKSFWKKTAIILAAGVTGILTLK